VPAVVDALRRANASVSAGDVDEGKRRYVVRTEGELASLDDVRAVMLRSESDATTGRVGRVTVGDIAEGVFAYKKPGATIRRQGVTSLALNAIRETGANVIEVMAGIHAALDDLNADTLPAAGLELEQVYDETTYINSAIDLVTQNIYIGGAFAALVLLLFLRSLRATLVVSLAIPVSVIGAFVAMAALGRSLNVISLAGIAFAVGMVVDAAIVVLENIYRLRQRGHPAGLAAYEGARQVWGAVLVSALTTVMVFLPVLIMKLEVGQLFRDIAVAISVAVLLSLVVSITVIPALSNRLLGGRVGDSATRLRLPLIDWLAGLFVAAVVGFTARVVRHKTLAILVVTVISSVACLATWRYLPKLEYLPEGNRNLAFGMLIPPPGYNLDTMAEIAADIEGMVRPLWASETGSESAPGEPPKMEHFFFVARPSRTFIGAKSVDPQRANELIPVLREAMSREPGTFGVVRQLSLFGRGLGGSRSINLDISGGDLEQILEVAMEATELVAVALPSANGTQFRPVPGLELGAPEVRVVPDRVRLADAGVTARELGATIDAFNDGLRVAEITVDGDRIDLTLRGPVAQIKQTQEIDNLPVVTRSGQILPASSLARVVVTSGPTEIRHSAPRAGADGDAGDHAGAQPGAGGGARHPAPRRDRPARGVRQAADWGQAAAVGHRGQAHPDLGRDGVGPLDRAGHRLSGDGGPVRELRLPAGDHAVGAAGGGRGGARPGGAEPVQVPAARHADAARLRDPDRDRGQQRHPAGASVAVPRPQRGHAGGRGDRRGDAQPHPADLHVDPHLGRRDAAASPVRRRRCRAISRPRLGGDRRVVAVGGADAGDHPAVAGDRHGRRGAAAAGAGDGRGASRAGGPKASRGVMRRRSRRRSTPRPHG
jgi:multidrug efflux pump subunit AcrB